MARPPGADAQMSAGGSQARTTAEYWAWRRKQHCPRCAGAVPACPECHGVSAPAALTPAPWYRCSRSGSGLCYWDGPQSDLAGFNHNRCPVCLSPAVPVPVKEDPSK